MVSVVLNANNTRKTIAVDGMTTVKTFLENNSVDPTRTPVYLNGSNVDIEKSFDELDITGSCILSAIPKTVNA